MMRNLLFLLLLSCSEVVIAAIDAYPFPNEELQIRYDNLIAELRCPQCLNTNLAGSDAMIAQDLRRETHRLLLEGKTDEEILEFMYERYGDFILYRPRMGGSTLVLWLGPFFFLLVAGVVLVLFLRGRKEQAVELNSEQQARLDSLLSEDKS